MDERRVPLFWLLNGMHNKMTTMRFSLLTMLWLCFNLVTSPSLFASTITHLSEGKIDNKSSIIVELEGTSTTINLPVKKDNVDIVPDWRISPDHSFQYFHIEKYGIGEYEISLKKTERKSGLDEYETVSIYETSPSIRLIGNGPFVNASGDRAIPVETINATAASLSIYKVNNIPELFSEYFYTNKLHSWRANRLRKNFAHQTDITFKLPPSRPNASQLANLTLPSELENGWYIITIKPSNSFEDPDIVQVLLSDIGLQAKLFEQSASIQAMDLRTGEPLAKGKVSIISEKGIRFTSSLSNGFAQFEYKERADTDIIVVEQPGRMAVLPMKEVPLDLSDFTITGNQQKELGAFVFSNRDLLKPAETLSTNIVLRKANGHLSDEKNLFVEVIKPDGSIALSQTLDEVVSGFFTFEFSIPKTAKLGKWAITVKTNPSSNENLGQFFFNVAEFTPERMDLDIELPEQIVAGEVLDAKVSGRYLFGQPASENRFIASTVLRSIDHFPGKFKSYYVGKQHYISSYEVPEEIDIKLDIEGQAEIELDPIDRDVLDGPARLTVNGQLFETGGATTTRIKRLLVTNQKSVVGIRPAADNFDYFDNADFSLLLLNHNGSKAIEGKATIKLERNRGGYYWVYNENSGWDLRQDDEWRLEEFKQLPLSIKPQEISLPVEWGDYRITATSPDGQETIYSFYVGWREGEAQIPVKPDQLALSLDQKSYKNGQDINIEINSPVSGNVTLELVGDKTYQQKQVNTQGKLTTQIQIPDSLERHDLYLIATLINTEKSYTRRLIAVQPVKLYREDRKLDVEVVTPEKFEPFTTQWVTVKAKSSHSLQQPYVVLTIADKGIINLSRYKVPDIFDWFYSQKRLNADLVDLYSRQFETRPSSFITHRYGGDMDGGNNRPLDDLVESKTFNHVFAPIRLDGNGEAKIKIDVPDYNGEVQVVATVIDGEQFGHQVKDVKVVAPIVAELSVPRFFATGSKSQVMLEASNQTDETQTITLSLTAKDGVELIGATPQTVKLAPNKSAAFPVDIRVGSNIATSTFTLSVKSPVYSVTRDWRVPVRSATPYVTKQTTKHLATGDTLAIAQSQWDGLLPILRGKSTVLFSRSPQFDPLAFAQGLYRYPYGCVEQTTSKAYPWLSNEPSLQTLKQQVTAEASSKEMLIKAISRLAGAQKSSGGFGLWNKDSIEEPWLTAYVTNFLLETQNQYPEILSDKMVSRAVKRAQKHLRDSTTSTEDKAYIGYILASHGKITLSDAATYLKRLSANSSLSQAQLGATFFLLGDMKTGQRFFISSQQQFAKKWIRSPNNYYESELSSAAKLISLISAVEKIGPIDSDLEKYRIEAVEKVLQLSKKRKYFSTQEKYALMIAGFDLQKINTQPVHINKNGRDTSVSKPIDVAIGDNYSNTSGSPLYVTQSVEGFAEPQSLLSSIKVKKVARTYYDKHGNKKHTDKFKVGELIVVNVEFELEEDISRAMLIDYLPAGMVLEHPDYTAADDMLTVLKMKSSDAEMIEYRNDRFVAAGSFDSNHNYNYYYVMRAETPGDTHLPNLYIEDMYSPERFIYEQASSTDKIKIQR
ncbi:hypothetical protein C1141_01045 [Vibrio agarivorans]|nr:hypothetical protein C1141_01045 [Vibrio agarivorans]